MKRGLSLLLRWLAMKIRHAVWIRWSALGLIVMTFVIVWMAILSTSWLRNVWHHLHTTWYHSSRAATSCSIRRSRRPAETFRELFDKRAGNVISRDVDGVRNTEDNQRTFGGQRQA